MTRQRLTIPTDEIDALVAEARQKIQELREAEQPQKKRRGPRGRYTYRGARRNMHFRRKPVGNTSPIEALLIEHGVPWQIAHAAVRRAREDL